MIIKSTRIQAQSGHKAVAAHVLRGGENEKITVLRGSEHILAEAMQDASDWGRKYGLRHFSISPHEATSRKQASAVVGSLAGEFGFDAKRLLLVEHKKPRSNGGFDTHWHVLVPEVDPKTGRVLDARHSFARQEKIARLSEIKFGHSITLGRHNRSVCQALRNDGKDMLAERIEAAGITEADLPKSAFTSDQHQIARRQGHNLPAIKATVAAAWKQSDSAKALYAALAENGLRAAAGDKANTWIITSAEGEFFGALHRLAGVSKNEISQRMKGELSSENRFEQHDAASRPTAKNIRRSASGAFRYRADNYTTHRRGGGSARRSVRTNHEQSKTDRAAAWDRTAKMRAATSLRAAAAKRRRSMHREDFLPTAISWRGKQIKSQKESEAVARRWREAGFQADADEFGTTINGDGWTLRDTGDRCTLSGAVTEEGVRAMVSKARRDWGGRGEFSGDQDFLNKTWLECKRQGVDFRVKNQPEWQPSEAIKRQWETERAAARGSVEPPAPKATMSPAEMLAIMQKKEEEERNREFEEREALEQEREHEHQSPQPRGPRP